MLVDPPTGLGTKGARTRAHLINTAVELFAELGVEQTTVRDISKRAAVANATFYSHFPDKESLASEVGNLVANTLFMQWQTEVGNLPDVLMEAALGSQWILQKAAENPHVGSLVAQALCTDGIVQQRAAADMQRFHMAASEHVASEQAEVDDLTRLVTTSLAAAIRLILSGRPLAPTQRLASAAILRIMGFHPTTAQGLMQAAHDKLAEIHADRGQKFTDQRYRESRQRPPPPEDTSLTSPS